MPWLLRQNDVLATLEVAESFRERALGLLGRDEVPGALLIRPARSVHTIGMRFAIDVAFCDKELMVLSTTTLSPFRLTVPRMRARCVIEAPAGAFARWGLGVGDQLEIKG
ncbi:MAG: DUF192 domain-containing protein [Acidimicrobiales bacterium]